MSAQNRRGVARLLLSAAAWLALTAMFSAAAYGGGWLAEAVAR